MDKKLFIILKIKNKMDILKIYLQIYQNKTGKLFLFFSLILFGTFLETLGIGLLIPLLSIIVNDMLIIVSQINSIFNDFPIIKNYLLSLSKIELLSLSVLSVFGLFSLKTLFLLSVGFFSARFIYDTQRKLAKTLFESYLNRPYSFFLNKNSAELMKNTTGEVGVFVGQVLIPIVYLFTELTVVISLTVFLLYIETLGTIIVFGGFFIFMSLLNFFSKGFLYDWGKQRQRETGMIIKTLQESFGAVKEIKLLGIEDELKKKFDKHNFATQRAESNMMAFQGVPKNGLEYFAICCFLGFLSFYIYNEKNLTLIFPLMAVYAATAFRLLPSANRILININAFRYGLPVVKVIRNELKAAKNFEKELKKNQVDTYLDFNEISFKNVDFEYNENGKKLFQDLSFSIRKGDTVGIYGPSGVGKSTLVDLICGLLDTTKGQIKINNQDIKNLKNSWQKIIGYVPQSPFFFDEKIKVNICFSYNEENIDEKKIIEKIKDVELSDFIKSLPNGINTLIGEKGTRVSGGQKQRIAIARALYKNSQILLMDEATSALDSAVEDKIINSINKIKKNKTIILISHRKSALKMCNKIFKLDGSGKVNLCKFHDL